jgi:uncharacterized membrane protein
MRVKTAKSFHPSQRIAWRSHEPSRIETFSDAVFAFALTLVIISLEVPKSFDELKETMLGAFSFSICFAVIFNIWNTQNMFFRRYGLKDNLTITLNAILLFVVLIYTFPLKFLFELIFSGQEKAHQMIHPEQTQSLMLIYGAGFIAIYILFYLMHKRALTFTTELELTPLEVYETKTATNINLLCISIGILAMLASFIPGNSGLSGFTYCLMPFAYTFWYKSRAKKRRKLFPEAA